jgi:cation transport ATPase
LLALRRHLQATRRQGPTMNLFVSIGPVIALIAGILILIMPRLLNYIVAIYLILVGVIGLFGPHLHG